jgi:hypothetical protein
VAQVLEGAGVPPRLAGAPAPRLWHRDPDFPEELVQLRPGRGFEVQP